MKKKIVGLLMSLAMVISSFAGMAGLFPRVVSAADVTFPVHLTVAADESGRMPTGLTLTDAAYDKYFGGTEGAAAAAVPEILSAGKLFINETAFPKDSEAFAADGFSVNESALTVSETGDAYAAAAVAAATKAVPIGNTITLSDEDSDGVADKIEYYCYAASIVNKITDNGDGTFKIERADIQDGVKPYDDNLFKAGEGLTVKTSDTLVVGDMVLAYKAGNEWKAVKAYEANGILVDGQDHVSYTIDNVNYPDAMRFSRENIVISNRCGELTNAMKYFALNNKEGYEVSLWIVPTAEDCETTGAPAGFTTGTSGKKILGAAIEQAEAKLNSVVISTDGSDVLTTQKWLTQEAYDELDEAIKSAKSVYDDESVAGSEFYDHQTYLLYLNLNGSGQDIGARFAGYDYEGFDNQVKEGTRVAGTPVIFDNDGETKITDSRYDKYFEGTAADGVAALLATGKCYINGIQIPANETDTNEYQINWVKSLWKTDTGWCYNVHKYTGADNMTFVDARKDLFDMTSTVRGHQTTMFVDENDICTAVNIESYEVVRVSEIEDMGHDTVIHRGDFELETQRVRYDIDLIHFPSENVADDIGIGDVAVFWYGSEIGGTAQWHIVRATPMVGKITSPEKSVYAVTGSDGEYTSVESNVSRYNLIDCSRPTQGYSVYTRLELTDNEIVLWNTPNGYPIGFTFGITKDASKANLAAAIENAKALEASVKVSEDGSGVRLYEQWAPQEAHDAFNAAIAEAENVYKANSSSHIDYDWAMWELRTAWGEGGSNPSGFVGEIGVNEGNPNEYVWYNDGETRITDAAFDKYFDGKTAAEGVAELLAAGKCSINGKPIPANETDTDEYQINYTKSLWKTDAGWCYNVHKYTGADNMTFVDARKDLFDMTSTVRGHFTTLTLDDNGFCTAIDIQSFEVVKIVYFEDHGGNVDKLNRGDFELETQRVRYDFNKITAIPSDQFDDAIDMGDVVVYWDGANGWEAVKAGMHVGVLSKASTGEYIVNEGKADEWKMIESNVSRYNLIDDTRPTQGYTAYVRLGLQEAEIPIITWVTPNDFPIGFSYGENAKAALTKALENAQELIDSVRASEDGTDVPSNRQWATQDAIDTFQTAIDEAKAVNNKNSSASWDREKAIYALNLAWGEGGSKPSGFVGELGYGSGEPEEEVELKSIEINPTKAVIDIGKELQLKAETDPKNYNSADLVWSSSDETIATVDDTGIVKAIANGVVTITVGNADGSISAECTVISGEDKELEEALEAAEEAKAEAEAAKKAAEEAIAAKAANADAKVAAAEAAQKAAEEKAAELEKALEEAKKASEDKSDEEPSPAQSGDQFPDVTLETVNKTSYNSIYWAVDNGIVKGYADGNFKPEDICTREQFTIMLWRFAGQPASDAATADRFTDAADFSNNTARSAAAWAVEAGIVSGFSDGSFQPQADITRAQVAVMLYRYAGKPAVDAAESKFSDIGTYSATVQQAIIWAENAGIASGYKDGTFKPDDGCQRQHMAIFLYRYDSNIK